MDLFENYDRRIKQIDKVLKISGIYNIIPILRWEMIQNTMTLKVKAIPINGISSNPSFSNKRNVEDAVPAIETIIGII